MQKLSVYSSVRVEADMANKADIYVSGEYGGCI